ncbi:MAG TPA: hypothetical protein DCQ98_03820 [Planctomycetaceae bacterium]|nr:hypothetical protein [Planctomycetaceae bacterium]
MVPLLAWFSGGRRRATFPCFTGGERCESTEREGSARGVREATIVAGRSRADLGRDPNESFRRKGNGT